MAAVGQVHGHNRVTGRQAGEISGHIGLATGVGLNVNMLAAKELLAAMDG